MEKKSLVALAAATVLTLGVTAGSYAWFTSTATQNNTFRAGTLGITLGSTNMDLGNMQCDDSRTFTYTINNLKDGVASSLDLRFTNDVTSDNGTARYDSLVEVAKYDISIDGNVTDGEKAAIAGKDLTYADLKKKLASPVVLKGAAKHEATYTIIAKLPQELTTDNTDNMYQGKPGNITITATANQTNK